jgi:FKBP-type peptidyl-prolyl cis-trans isomerase SlyD
MGASMKIAPGTVVTLAYDICDANGEIIESSDLSGPITFLAGKAGLIPGLDRRLEGMAAGEEGSWEFPPEEAFGRIEDGPMRVLSRGEFPAEAKVEVGERFEAGLPGGNGQRIVLQVAELDADVVKVRMLHPLAGQKISMSVKVVGVREATAAENEAGKAMSRPPPPPPAPRK